MKRSTRSFVTLAFVGVSGLLLAGAGDDAVKTDYGVVSGTSENGVRVFKGIPYAAPPVGDLRWRAPARPAAWTGVRAATEFGAQCMQAPYPQDSPYYAPPRAQSEDCLFLNVWTAAEAGAKRPVMVW